jgi:hypothetical protein
MSFRNSLHNGGPEPSTSILRNSFGGGASTSGPVTSFAASGSGSSFNLPSTPARQHKSAFAQITRPTLPPAKDAFEPQLKAILRRRLRRVFAFSAALAFVFAALSNIDGEGSEGWMGWLFYTLLKSGVWLGVGMVPTIFARKRWIQGEGNCLSFESC